MANTKEIKDRIHSIEDTMKITSAHVYDLFLKNEAGKKELAATMPYFFRIRGGTDPYFAPCTRCGTSSV